MTDFERSSLDIDRSLRIARPALGDITVAFGSMALGVVGLATEVAYIGYKKAPLVADALRTRIARVADAISAVNQRRSDEFNDTGAQTAPVPPYLLPDNSEFVTVVGRPTISAVQEVPRV